MLNIEDCSYGTDQENIKVEFALFGVVKVQKCGFRE